MAFTLVPCPGLYLGHKNRRPKVFVQYCESFIQKNYEGMKAVGIQTLDDGAVMIMAMPDMESRKPVVTFKQVKGKKTKEVNWENRWKVPIERFLNQEDFDYLKSKGRDKHGNKIQKGMG